MAPKVKVLIVDDSVLARKVLSDVVAAESDMEVVGVASNGKLALQRLPTNDPDIVILDFEMPEMSGLETIDQIRKLRPKLPIVMFSAATATGARETLDALSRGANDYVAKPTNTKNLDAAKQQISQELIPKLRALCAPEASASKTTQVAPLIPRSSELPTHRLEVLAIGVSTGGPNALASVIPAFPANFPIPILVTQHMPPMFTRMLAERLSQASKLPVIEASDGMLVSPGKVLIAPGGSHLKIVREGVNIVARLSDDPPENSCRPAVDYMFRSILEIYGRSTLGLILTGMGVDGVKGCQGIRKAGGAVFVQDKASSVVWGMPGAVAEAGLAHKILPLSTIAKEICQLLGNVEAIEIAAPAAT